MRISGLASGMDVDSIVKKLMEAQSTSLTKLKKKSITIDYKQEAYRSVSSMLVDFRNNTLPNLRLSGAINAKRADVTGNTSAISVTTTSAATAGVYNVQVKNLGAAASAKVSLGASATSSADNSLASLGFSGDKITIANDNGTDAPVEINFDLNDTLQTLLNNINSNAKANVTALYDSNTGDIILTSKTTGERTFTVSGFPDITGDDVKSTGGVDGTAIVNGVELKATNNQVTINGITIRLSKETGTDPVSTVTVGTDSQKILENIKAFISEYNKVLGTLNEKLSEERYPKFTPLTDEERSDLGDTQSALWDTKAKSGLLKRDITLSQLTSDLRTAIISDFGVKGYNIQSIGITTGSWYEKGKLVIENETKLLEAIESDPEKIEQLFTNRVSSESGFPAGQSKVNNINSGIFSRLSDILMDSLKLLSERVGTSQVSTSLTEKFLPNSLMSTEKDEISRKITEMNRKLNIMETRYYKQFTAMESALNKLNSQSSSISSLLG